MNDASTLILETSAAIKSWDTAKLEPFLLYKAEGSQEIHVEEQKKIIRSLNKLDRSFSPMISTGSLMFNLLTSNIDQEDEGVWRVKLCRRYLKIKSNKKLNLHRLENALLSKNVSDVVKMAALARDNNNIIDFLGEKDKAERTWQELLDDEGLYYDFNMANQDPTKSKR
jgi:hypothetical protein